MVMSPSWVAGWCTMSSQRRMYVGLQWHIRKMGLVCYPLTLRPSPWSESLDKPLIQCVTVCDATHWYAVRSLPPQWSRYCTKLHMKRNAEKTIIIIDNASIFGKTRFLCTSVMNGSHWQHHLRCVEWHDNPNVTIIICCVVSFQNLYKILGVSWMKFFICIFVCYVMCCNIQPRRMYAVT